MPQKEVNLIVYVYKMPGFSGDLYDLWHTCSKNTSVNFFTSFMHSKLEPHWPLNQNVSRIKDFMK